MRNADGDVIRGSLTGAYQLGRKNRADGLGVPRFPGDWLYMNGWNDAIPPEGASP
jgi:hypothetical protein